MPDRLADVAISILTHPLEQVSQPSERVYWPFLLGALALGFAVCLWRARSLRPAVRALLSRKIWWHRSARMDYRLIVANGVIQVLVLAPLVLSALAVAVWTVDVLTRVLGEATPSSMSRGAIVAVYTVVLFVAWDLSRYVVHRLLHEVPALWEFHKVHHSAEVLTPFTVLRVHPVESLLFQLRGALVTGVVTGAFFYAFADRAVQYEILGVNALGMVFNAVAANLRHSHVWMSFGRAVERVLISPAQHQIHHSVAVEDHGTNYGSVLAVWDWIGGTLRLAGRRRGMRFGLTGEQQNHHPARVGSALIGPFAALARRLAGSRAAARAKKGEHEATAI